MTSLKMPEHFGPHFSSYGGGKRQSRCCPRLETNARPEEAFFKQRKYAPFCQLPTRHWPTDDRRRENNDTRPTSAPAAASSFRRSGKHMSDAASCYVYIFHGPHQQASEAITTALSNSRHEILEDFNAYASRSSTSDHLCFGLRLKAARSLHFSRVAGSFSYANLL